MDKSKIIAIKDFILSAEKSIKSAKKLLREIINENGLSPKWLDFDLDWLHTYKSDSSKIIEWVFTWEDMLWTDNNNYPVPANYASKSKLVQWDKLKLTIDWLGKMLYKQIEPIEREIKVGILSQDKQKYQVIAEWKTYNVLTAAVTHFKWEIWNKASIVVPKWKDATFAAIENIFPKLDNDE